MGHSSSLRPRPVLVLPVVLIGAFALTACGAGSGKATGSGGTTASVKAPTTGCGAISAQAPKDPDGALASLPKTQQQALDQWPLIHASKWKNWKPGHSGPFRVAIVAAGGVDPLQTTIFRELQSQLKASSMIGSVSFTSTGQQVDVGLQLQQYNQAVQKKPDLIIAEPLQPDAFESFEKKAGEAGIPTINFLGDVDSPYALNVDNNTYLATATMMSWLVRGAGNKGDFLYVHGFPGTPADSSAFTSVKSLLKSCPQAKLAGDVIGAYINSAAKQETLKFLATHPRPLAGVIQAGGMGSGVIGAFTSSGRPVPPLGDAGAVQGSLVYWNKHRDTYNAIGFGQPAKGTATAIVSIALRTLAGQGPRINSFLPPVPLITKDNLGDWVDTSQSETSDIAAEGPRDAFLSEDYLNGLFDHGKPPA